MNANLVVTPAVSAAFAWRTARALQLGAALAILATFAACSAGGGPGVTVNQPTSSSSTADAYTGPAPANAVP